jgi:hypothetical protein
MPGTLESLFTISSDIRAVRIESSGARAYAALPATASGKNNFPVKTVNIVSLHFNAGASAKLMFRSMPLLSAGIIFTVITSARERPAGNRNIKNL